jgi:hypothetical protein
VKLKFVYHSQYRLYQREISTEDIKNIIRNPDIQQPSFNGRIKATKKLRDTIISVVYVRTKKEYLIITVI